MPPVRRPGAVDLPARPSRSRASGDAASAASPAPDERNASDSGGPKSARALSDAFAEGGKIALDDVKALSERAVSVRNGSAVLHTRVLADALQSAGPSTSLGGVRVQGLDLSKVESGRLQLYLPLREGTFVLPTKNEGARTSVKSDAKLRVDIVIERGADGAPRIASAVLAFEPRLTIENPKAALMPSTGRLAGAFDWMQDAAGDVHLDAIRLEADGSVFVDGVVGKPWPLKDSPLNDVIPPGTFPKLNMDLGVIARGGVIREAAVDDGAPGPGLDTLLAHLGAATDAGVFELDLQTERTRLVAHGNGISMSSKESPITLDIDGQVQLDDDGTLRLLLPDDPDLEVQGGMGAVDIAGDVVLRAGADGGVLGTSALATRAHVEGVSGTVDVYAGASLPLAIKGPDNIVVGKTSLAFDGDTVLVKTGSATARLKAELPALTTLEISGTHVDIVGGQLISDASFCYRSDDGVLAIEDGKVDVRLQGQDARARKDGVLLRAGGDVEVRLRGERIRVDAGGLPRDGTGTVRLQMPGESDDGSPLWAEMPFALEPDGSVRLSPAKSGLIEVMAPVSKVCGQPENLVDPRSPAVGDIGSGALKEHVGALTKATLRDGNRVKLLVDGAMSREERLAMIRSAKESICLQTLIFKDDETGRETVQELLAAKQRGVEVRVIIDALGNVEKPHELTDGKDLYQTLRDGGVELVLFNDPASSRFGGLLREVFADPEVANVSDFTTLLQDPMKAVPLMQRIARIATGGARASATTRERVATTLNAVTHTPIANALSTNAKDLAAVAAGNPAKAAELLTALRLTAEFNYRWHEKYLVVDGKAAVSGGMNIGDEYLFGGTDRKVVLGGKEKPAWRDTDVAIYGPSATDVYTSFARNWKTATGEDLPPAKDASALVVPDADGGGLEMHVLQHRPREDGDHHITNFMIENLKALKRGDKAYIANAYFLPTGALTGYKQALMDAARRGVDVRVVTNSENTTDLPQLNQAALSSYQELLRAGVRIFERTGEQCMHTKAAVFGGNTATVGSWNADNRSASLNSESLTVIYDDGFAKSVESMIERDMAADVAQEVTAASVNERLYDAGIQNQVVTWFANLM